MTEPTNQKLPKVQLQRVERSFSGPLPPPEALAQYNDVIPGAAERILAMAEKQQLHRQKLELEVIRSNINAQRLGVLLGFFIALTATGGGIYLIANGQSVGGLVSILATLVALVGTFIYGKKEAKSIRTQKKL